MFPLGGAMKSSIRSKPILRLCSSVVLIFRLPLATDGAPEHRQGRRRQPRQETVVKKFLAVAALLVLSGVLGATPVLAGSTPSFSAPKDYGTGPVSTSV